MNGKSSAVIDVRFADPPKDGKKQGTIKTTTGDVFGVWPDKLGLFRPGRTYKVEFTERNYQGRTYRTITMGEPAPVEANGSPAPNPLDPPADKVPAGETEFVSRMVAAAVSSQLIDFNPQEIGRAARMVQSVYREWLRHSPEPAK